MTGGGLLAVALAGAAATVVTAGAERRPLPAVGRRADSTASPPALGGVPSRRWPASGLTTHLMTVAASWVLGWVVSGVVLAVVAAILAGTGLRARDRRRRRVASEQERRRGVEACLAIAAELRAGRTVADALDEGAAVAVGSTRVRLATAARVARTGGDVGAVLRASEPAAARRPVLGAGPATSGDPAPPAVEDALRALAGCWQVSAAAGTGLAEAVDRLADGLAARAALDRAVQAELAGPRATAVLLAGLPGPGLLLGAGLGADPLRVLLHTPVGAGCLLLGLALELLGLAWTRRLTESVA